MYVYIAIVILIYISVAFANKEIKRVCIQKIEIFILFLSSIFWNNFKTYHYFTLLFYILF